MKQLINVLILLAAAAFLLGVVGRVANTEIIWQPEVYWRGAVGLLAFAIALTLIQIRDK